VLQRLKTAVARMFDIVPGGVRKTLDAQKAFDIDAKLSWQIFKLVGPGDALSLAPHIPKPARMRRLLEAAAKRGIPAEAVEEVREAYAAFEQLIDSHAGDRSTFDTMATSASPFAGDEDAQQAELQDRKARYKADRRYAGAEVETLLTSFILYPGSERRLCDYVPLRCRLGQRRLRPDADVVVDRFLFTDTVGHPKQNKYEPLDGQAAKQHGAMLVPRFCSEPLPKLRTSTESNGFTYAMLDGDAVGQSSRADLVFGQVHRNAPILDRVDGRLRWHTNVQITIPTTVIVVDKLIHRSTFPKWDYKMAVHWQGPRETFDPSSMHELPFRERITRIEAGVAGAYLREAPRYLELLHDVTSHLGWRLEDFDIYRLRIEYPLLYTALQLRFELKQT
jgi:hypothetical protein